MTKILTKFRIKIATSLILPIAAGALSLFIPELTDAIVTSTLVGMVLVFLSLIYRDLETDIEAFRGEVKSDLDDLLTLANNQAFIQPVREANFYERFKSDVSQANNRVFITYFDNTDPRKSTDGVKTDYYDEINKLISHKSVDGVQFRRIVRAIPEHKEWIDDMIQRHDDTSRFSLACIPDEEPESPRKPHVSVQLIDDDITYFVAVGEQRESSEPRDMFVRSKDLNAQWNRYYEQLWNDSYIVFRRGQVREDEYEQFEEHIEGLSD